MITWTYNGDWTLNINFGFLEIFYDKNKKYIKILEIEEINCFNSYFFYISFGYATKTQNVLCYFNNVSNQINIIHIFKIFRLQHF